jgi:hypothetical protein
VSGLGGEDACGSSQVCRVGDVLSCSEVGRDTDTLEDLGEGEERRDVRVAKLVIAGLDWGGSGSR